MADMIFPQEGFVYRSQGIHGNPSSEDYGWRAAAGGCNQWLLASDDGVIEALRDGRSWSGSTGSDLGNYFTLKMDNGCKIRCGHMQKGSFQVKAGQRVKKGQRIGRMGNSGTCLNQAYHTHMTFWNASGKVVLPSQSGMKVYKDAVIYEGQASMFTYESGVTTTPLGSPVARDASKDQIEVTIDNLRARKRPELNSDVVVGFINKGVYNIIATRDMTKEASNGYFWYCIEDATGAIAWIAFDTSWAVLYPKEAVKKTMYTVTAGLMSKGDCDRVLALAKELNITCTVAAKEL